MIVHDITVYYTLNKTKFSKDIMLCHLKLNAAIAALASKPRNFVGNFAPTMCGHVPIIDCLLETGANAKIRFF